MTRFILLLVAVLVVLPAQARIPRSHATVRAFVRAHACPSTGRNRMPCPGWIVDHRHALCVGGQDSPANMMWMTVQAAKAKDRWECKPGWRKHLQQCDADLAECTGDAGQKGRPL